MIAMVSVLVCVAIRKFCKLKIKRLINMLNTKLKPVTLFTSNDEGAPVLSASAGSLKALLKACLVTGYGNKTRAGLGNAL